MASEIVCMLSIVSDTALMASDTSLTIVILYLLLSKVITKNPNPWATTIILFPYAEIRLILFLNANSSQIPKSECFQENKQCQI